MKRLTIEIDEEMFTFLKGMAAYSNITLRLLVTRLLNDYAKEQKKLGFRPPVIPEETE